MNTRNRRSIRIPLIILTCYDGPVREALLRLNIVRTRQILLCFHWKQRVFTSITEIRSLFPQRRINVLRRAMAYTQIIIYKILDVSPIIAPACKLYSILLSRIIQATGFEYF